MSQTNALAWRVSQEFKTEISSIGTGILKVCECPKLSQNSAMDLRGSVSMCARVCVCECVQVCIYDSL